MRHIYIILFLFATKSIFGFTLNVSSSVLNINNNNPISNHRVYIEAFDSTYMYYYSDSTVTDSNGNYLFTTNNVPSNNITFTITTYDCNNSIQYRLASTTSQSVNPFLICTSNPSNNHGDIYGYVYADSTYLNSNNATIELYILDSAFQKLILVDTTHIINDTNGSYFLFLTKSYGNYYIKCRLNNNRINNNVYYSTWYGNTIHWDSAKAIVVNSPATGAFIILKKPDIYLSGGSSSISGNIDLYIPVSYANINIYLYKSSGFLVKKTTPDNNGTFYFDSLIIGDYYLIPNLINYNSLKYNFTISKNNEIINNLRIGLNPNGFYVGNNEITKPIKSIRIYPNPATTEINVSFKMTKNATVRLQLFNIIGATIYDKSTNINSNSLINIPINKIKSGIYIISISTDYTTIIRKFIKE